METTSSIFIRRKARELLVSCWKRRIELWRGKVKTVDDFLIYATEKIATDLLGLKVTRVSEIPDNGIFYGKTPSAEVVGILNRPQKSIFVAQKYGFEQSRFTLAHEIAHYILHPGLVLHREMPLNHGRHPSQLSLEEREANLFGAELLMPSKLVQEQFIARFAGIVDGTRCDESLFYWMSRHEPTLNKKMFFDTNPRHRARHIAKSRYCYGQPVVSLCDFFRVSPSALAIQLLDLGLVK
jgi:Zn-dependent peptidase ImmA (M78 family)